MYIFAIFITRCHCALTMKPRKNRRPVPPREQTGLWRFLPRASMAYPKRQATEAKSRGKKEWIEERTKKRRSYIPPRKPGFRKELKSERKAVASRYYQLLTGHALVAPSSKTSSRKPTRANVGGVRPEKIKPENTSSSIARGGNQRSTCCGQP